MTSSPFSLRRLLPEDPFERAAAQADRLAARLGDEPYAAALVCGSGVSAALAHLGEVVGVPMTELELPAANVAGHRAEVCRVTMGGHSVLVLGGRVHAYEGYRAEQLCAGVRLAAAAGVPRIVLSSAVGSLRPEWTPGTVVLVRDHLNLAGVEPLAGRDPEPNGTSRFTDLTDVYSGTLRARLAAALALPEGVLAARRGPSYETPAEIEMLRRMGADLAGMSMVWEAIAARHLGLEVVGLGLVTNLAAGLAGPLDHAEVTETAHASAAALAELLAGAIATIAA